MSCWSLYLFRCHNGTLYTGITTDVERRFEEHCNGSGAKYLRGKGPLELAFRCEIGDRGEALSLEHAVKQLGKAEKEILAAAGEMDARKLHAMLTVDSQRASD